MFRIVNTVPKLRTAKLVRKQWLSSAQQVNEFVGKRTKPSLEDKQAQQQEANEFLEAFTQSSISAGGKGVVYSDLNVPVPAQNVKRVDLSSLTTSGVSKVLHALKISVNFDDVVSSGIDGEMLSVLEHNSELQEIGLKLPALKFKVLLKHLAEFSQHGVPTSLLSNASSGESRSILHSTTEPEIVITQTTPPRSSESAAAATTSTHSKTSNVWDHSSSKSITPASAVHHMLEPFPIHITDMESILQALETICAHASSNEPMFTSDSVVTAMQTIIKYITGSAENQALAGEAGVGEQAVDNLLALTATDHHHPALVVETLNLVAVLCRHSPGRDCTSDQNVKDLEDSGCIEAVVKILESPKMSGDASVISAACRVIQYLAVYPTESFTDAHTVSALLTVLKQHHDSPTVMVAALGALTNLCTVDGAVNAELFSSHFSRTLHDILSRHFENAEVVSECMWCLRNHAAEDSSIQKQIRDSRVLRFLPLIFNKYRDNTDLVVVTCHAIANLCVDDVANRIVLGTYGIPELLASVFVDHTFTAHYFDGQAHDPAKDAKHEEVAVAVQVAIRDLCMDNEDNRRAAEEVINLSYEYKIPP